MDGSMVPSLRMTKAPVRSGLWPLILAAVTLTPRFAYARPETLADALTLLEQRDGAVAMLAGGTDLVVALRDGAAPRTVVDIKHIAELPRGISIEGGRLRIGATTVMADVERDERVRRMLPALAAAAKVVGSVQIRNRATVIGNICHASPAADTVPALLVYRAVVNVVGPNGGRRVPLAGFLLGPGRTVLEPHELVTSVDVPLADTIRASAFGRITRRRGVDLATVNAACAVDVAGSTRFAYGAVGPRPVVVADLSGILADRAASREQKERALAELLTATAPISDVRAGREYREAMLTVLSLRLLDSCLARLGDAG